MNDRLHQALAGLRARVAINNARVRSDPLPYLMKADESITEVLMMLDDLERALSPDIIFDFGLEMELRPQDIRGQDTIKLSAVRKVIREYREGKYRS